MTTIKKKVYRKVLDPDGLLVCITRNTGTTIPLDPNNKDYAEYLLLLAQGKALLLGAAEALPVDVEDADLQVTSTFVQSRP